MYKKLEQTWGYSMKFQTYFARQDTVLGIGVWGKPEAGGMLFGMFCDNSSWRARD